MTVLRAAAVVLAVAGGVVGVWRGTWAVGGSDSSCYALMAQAFARGEWQPSASLVSEAPWPDAAKTFAPGGFLPSPVRADAASPVCAPGFSLLLAPLYRLAGPDGVFWLTPVAGALLVFVTFVLGARISGETAGLAAAFLIAVSPVFIFQLVQPMNDIVVAALWTGIVTVAVGRGHHWSWIGVLTGVAILVRPNLAPAAVAVGVWCLMEGWRPFARFAVAFIPFGLVLLVLNTALYGDPLGSGYGPARELFSAANVPPNLANYSQALWQTQLGFPLLGLAALACRSHEQGRSIRMVTLVAAGIVSVYLFYRPLPEWWYLRFLLPALPMLTALAVATLLYLTRRHWLLGLVTLVVAGHGMTSTAMDEALDLARLEGRFRLAGAVTRERLPANAVYFTVWQSGTVRFHADREAVLWDSLDPASLDSAVQWLTSRGREPYLVLEDWEEPLFRERFAAHSTIGRLDWPPRFDIDRRVRIYMISDRARYWAGGSVPSEVVFGNRP